MDYDYDYNYDLEALKKIFIDDDKPSHCMESEDEDTDESTTSIVSYGSKSTIKKIVKKSKFQHGDTSLKSFFKTAKTGGK